MTVEKNHISGALGPVVEAGRHQVSREAKVVRYETRFIEQLGKLIESECPELRNLYDSVVVQLNQHYACRTGFVNTESRAVEDLNDIIERFTVVCRASSRYASAKSDLKSARSHLSSARSKLAQDRAQGGKNEGKLMEAVRKQMESVKQKIRALQDRIREYIEQKEKFNAFRHRRLVECFTKWGQGSQHWNGQDSEAWKAIEVAVNTAQERYVDIIKNGGGEDIVVEAPEKPAEFVAKRTEEVHAQQEEPEAQPEETYEPPAQEEVQGYEEPQPEAEPEQEPEPAQEEAYEPPQEEVQGYDAPEQEPEPEPEQEAAENPHYNPFDEPF